MSSDLDLLRTLEATYLQDLINHLEAMPEAQRPAPYLKLAGVRKLLALSEPGGQPGPLRGNNSALDFAPLPAPRTLTEDAVKKEIRGAVMRFFARRGNKPTTIRDTLSTLVEEGIRVPGKSPASTLAALISRDSTGTFHRVGEGVWRLTDDQYTKITGDDLV